MKQKSVWTLQISIKRKQLFTLVHIWSESKSFIKVLLQPKTKMRSCLRTTLNLFDTLQRLTMWPWTTKPVISVNFFKLRFIHNLKAELVSFPLMYGLLWYDNIWKIWNLMVQKNQNTEKIAFKVVQIKFLAMYITNQKLYIYGRQFTKYRHGTWFVHTILMIFGIKEKSIILTHAKYFGYCYKYTPAT